MDGKRKTLLLYLIYKLWFDTVGRESNKYDQNCSGIDSLNIQYFFINWWYIKYICYYILVGNKLEIKKII